MGSLFGVWRAPSLLNVTGESLLAAGAFRPSPYTHGTEPTPGSTTLEGMGLGACTYGPRTTLAVALAGSGGVAEFLLVPGEIARDCPRLPEIARDCPRLPEVARGCPRLPEVHSSRCEQAIGRAAAARAGCSQTGTCP